MWIRTKGFEALNDDELDHLMQAPALITVLIGLADGELDREERTWPEKLMRDRKFVDSPLLKDFYMVVAEGFWASLSGVITHLPASVADRTGYLSDALTALNPLLAKLEPELAAALYRSFLQLAKAVMETPSNQGRANLPEAKWVDLPMLKPMLLS